MHPILPREACSGDLVCLWLISLGMDLSHGRQSERKMKKITYDGKKYCFDDYNDELLYSLRYDIWFNAKLLSLRVNI